MLDSRRGNAQRGGGASNTAKRFDHGGNGLHCDVMYDYRTERQALLYDNRPSMNRTIIVQSGMDDRDRISQALAARNASREALAEALSVSVPSVGRLLRKERTLKAGERDAAFRFLQIEESGERPRVIPVIGLIAAGAWADAVQEPLGYTWAPFGGPNAFALRVDGDSMDHIVMPGANVIIDPDDRALRDGKAYAVMNELGEATFKTFRNDPARFEPASRNPNHTTIRVGEDGFTVIGRAIGSVTEM